MPGASRVMVNMPASLFPLPAPQHLPAGPLPPTWAFTVNPRQVARGETDWTLGQRDKHPRGVLRLPHSAPVSPQPCKRADRGL